MHTSEFKYKAVQCVACNTHGPVQPTVREAKATAIALGFVELVDPVTGLSVTCCAKCAAGLHPNSPFKPTNQVETFGAST